MGLLGTNSPANSPAVLPANAMQHRNKIVDMKPFARRPWSWLLWIWRAPLRHDFQRPTGLRAWLVALTIVVLQISAIAWGLLVLR